MNAIRDELLDHRGPHFGRKTDRRLTTTDIIRYNTIVTMHLILTGATGFIGREVLRQCLAQPKVTKITILSRRVLSSIVTEHPKVRVIITENFMEYDADDLGDADGCIWCLGGQSVETDLAYPVAFAKAMSEARSNQARQQPFRFVLCSGVLAERDQDKPLWFMEKERRAKGKGESEILSFTNNGVEEMSWESYVMRPSMVLPVQASLPQRMMSVVLGGIRVDDLAHAAMRLALDGHLYDTLDNTALIAYGCLSAAPH